MSEQWAGSGGIDVMMNLHDAVLVAMKLWVGQRH